MKIILHGTLAERFGREFEIQSDVPADAIEGLTRQIPDWPRDLLIDVVGFPTEQLLRAPTDRSKIHLVPSMHGGGGSWLKIALGAALIAASLFLPPIGIVTGLTLNTVLFTVGASVMMMGISQLLMKAPTIDKSADPEASKYLTNNKNTVAINTPIILAGGRIKLAGHWLSVQVNSNDLVTTSFPATTS